MRLVYNIDAIGPTIIYLMPPSKRFQAVSFFITYPRINDSSNDARLRLLQFLQQLGTTNETELTYALIATERHHDDQQPQGNLGSGTSDSETPQRQQHCDGGQRSEHWHALAHYSSKLRLGERSFDFEGNHPNIKCVGRKKSDWDRVSQYCRKEDPEPLEFGTPRFVGHSVWSEVSKASSRIEAEKIISQEKPRDWIINRRNIDYALDKMFPLQSDAQIYLPRYSSQSCLPVEIETWKLENFVYAN